VSSALALPSALPLHLSPKSPLCSDRYQLPAIDTLYGLRCHLIDALSSTALALEAGLYAFSAFLSVIAKFYFMYVCSGLASGLLTPEIV